MTASIVWFRRDLRLGDHPALHAACREDAAVVPLFVWDERLLDAGSASAARRLRLEAAVAALQRDLRAHGGRLVIRRGNPRQEVPSLAREIGASTVHASRDYTPYARARDDAVGREVQLRLHGGQLLQEPEELGDARVFTSFHRRWAALPVFDPLPAPHRLVVPAGVPGEASPAVDPWGEAEAHQRLRQFARGTAHHYGSDRDRLDRAGTSRLSADLHLGTISPRQAFHGIQQAAFRRQLAWRDWASHVLFFRPQARRDAWQPRYRGLAWLEDEITAEAWKRGMTGYPAVDAAMRQLAEEGWIHNRARLIVASFLAKDLLLDWRIGEAHFLASLIDGDVANNSLNWQWAAGVGTDAAPFFRMLNPVIQSKRFDPDGVWIRRWVPELAGLGAGDIHEPWSAKAGPPRGYPVPIVEHAAARQRAMEWFSRYAAASGRREVPEREP
jgi:deoxyribodipyrimidine photo-lyase